MRSAIIGVLLFLGWATAAEADVMAGGGLHGSIGVRYVVCTLINAGTSAVPITSIAIYSDSSAPETPLFNECVSSLGGHRTCEINADAFAGGRFHCRAVVGNKTNIRGVLDLRDANGATMSSVEVR